MGRGRKAEERDGWIIGWLDDRKEADVRTAG